MPTETTLTCPLCTQEHALIPLASGETAKCVRCNTQLATASRFGVNAPVAFALTGLVFAVPAAFLPFMTVEKFGNVRSGNFLTSVSRLDDQGMPLLAIWVLVCGGLTPLFLLCALAFSRGASERTHRLGHVLAHWAMPEVYVLGTLVALTRLGSLVEVEINAGFWSYVATSIALLLSWRAFRLQLPTTRHEAAVST